MLVVVVCSFWRRTPMRPCCPRWAGRRSLFTRRSWSTAPSTKLYASSKDVTVWSGSYVTVTVPSQRTARGSTTVLLRLRFVIRLPVAYW